LASLYGLLLILPAFSLAQVGHVHDWEAVSNIDAPGLVPRPPDPLTGDLVALELYHASHDADLCLNNGTGQGDECPFFSNTAYNALKFTA
jgi:hypothetical protein